MAAHLLGLNYETEAAVNISHNVLYSQSAAGIFIIWPRSIFKKIKAQTMAQRSWTLWQLCNGGLMRTGLKVMFLPRIEGQGFSAL